jgi:hypothetical protein|tara:strand:+ start:248 stop:727 length:480 start_codon:yes stop_codon:yes gene_type:complete
MQKTKSYREGTEAEQEFIALRGDNVVREANWNENVNEHWDVLDKEFGRVDVKAAKRKYRNGPVDNTIWWELKTVKRPPNNESAKGWGVPNGIDRYIAIKTDEYFFLVKPERVIDKINEKCKDYYRGEFGLHTRPTRGDLMTILPLSFLQEHAEHKLKIA